MDLNNYVVHIRRGTKRITLQRFLCSKIAYGKEVSEVELAAIFHNQLWLQTKSLTDPKFREKFGRDLESLTAILKTSNFSRGLTEGAAKRMKEQLQSDLENFLIPQRNLQHIEALMRRAVYTRWRKPEGVEISRLPPEKHIGKGYRDHGTAQRAEIDGSPSWQEVGRVSAQLEGEQHAILEEVYRLGGEGKPIETLRSIIYWLRNKERLEEIANRRNSIASKATASTGRKK